MNMVNVGFALLVLFNAFLLLSILRHAHRLDMTKAFNEKAMHALKVMGDEIEAQHLELVHAKDMLAALARLQLGELSPGAFRIEVDRATQTLERERIRLASESLGQA